MANIVEPFICGVDVSLETLDIAQSDNTVLTIPNTQQAITKWLKGLAAHTRIALEATNDYHQMLLDQALLAKLEVYVINGKQLHHYREAVGQRAKTDIHDAQLLLRYLSHEYTHLTPAKPLNNQQKRLWRLLKRRAMLVKVKTQLRLSMEGDPEIKDLTKGLMVEVSNAIANLERRMRVLAKEMGWSRVLQHCQTIPGIGELNALALVACFHRGTFKTVDAFIAYLGLDIRVRDSGKLKGKGKLTKRGEPEVRRLLFNAAMSFARNPLYKPLYERMRNRGMSSTAAYVALARKLARIAFALMVQGKPFEHEKLKVACVAT